LRAHTYCGVDLSLQSLDVLCGESRDLMAPRIPYLAVASMIMAITYDCRVQ
jgi:hypothetical protein